MICPSCGSENIDGSDRCENCLGSFRDLDIPGAESAEGLARHVMEDRLDELHVELPIAVSPETRAIEVVKRMKELNTGCALVLDREKLVGIFTEHDVLIKLFSHSTTHEAVSWQSPVSKLMTPNPETLGAEESVAFALNKMSLGRFRHIPIAKSDGSYTVASIKSVLKYIAREDW
jgi:CBS domain-containing protein